MGGNYSSNGDYASTVLRGTVRQCERWLRSYKGVYKREKLQLSAFEAEGRFIANAVEAHKTLNAFFPNPPPGSEASALKRQLGRAERRLVALCNSSKYRSADSYLRRVLDECSSFAEQDEYDAAWTAWDLLSVQFIRNHSRPIPLRNVRTMVSQALSTPEPRLMSIPLEPRVEGYAGRQRIARKVAARGR